MKRDEYTPTVVDFAYQIIEMDRELCRLRMELDTAQVYQQRYMDLLNESTAHSAHMIGGILELALKPGVMDAITKANSEQSS